MASRTIQTTDIIEEALSFLSKEKNTKTDDYVMEKLSYLFSDLVAEANQKKYDRASKILESKDPAKIIPALKDLLL